MTTIARLALAIMLNLGFATAAVAQDGPVGIAIVEAPEQGGGVCFADNLDKGFECARDQCASEAGQSADCYRVRWCYPAGWSADVFIQNQEGFHFHDYLCGWQSREDLEAAIAVKCDRTTKDWLLECATVRMWDNQGEEIALE